MHFSADGKGRSSTCPTWLDTLAAAYAANDRFAEAIETAGRAVQAAQATAVANPSVAPAFERYAAGLEARRKLYQTGKPCRNPLR